MPAAPPTTAPALSLANVSCTFISKDDPGQRYTAVRDVNLDVGAGEFVSVVGPTGRDVQQRALAATGGPTTETNSPAPTSRFTSRTAV